MTDDELREACARLIRSRHAVVWSSAFWATNEDHIKEASTWFAKQVEDLCEAEGWFISTKADDDT